MKANKAQPEGTIEIRLLRLPEVMRTVGLSRSTIYYLMDEGLFPSPIRLGKRTIAWHQTDLISWINSREPAHRIDL